MSPSSAAANKTAVPLAAILTTFLGVLAVLGALFYLSRPVQKEGEGAATQEAKAYLANLALSDVTMQASENLMNQKVVEVLGSISNNGPRALKSIDVYCLFYSVDGHLLHRERLRIIGGPDTRGPLKPGATKSFRMPFDSLPEGWNQALPKMVIAQITFVN
jgi:hypothetical protein